MLSLTLSFSRSRFDFVADSSPLHVSGVCNSCQKKNAVLISEVTVNEIVGGDDDPPLDLLFPFFQLGG